MLTGEEWSRVDDSARSSTVAYFITGWEDDEDNEVLIWRAPEDENGAHFEVPDDVEVPEGSKYLIEILEGEDVQDLKFSVSLAEAVEKGLDSIVNSDAM